MLSLGPPPPIAMVKEASDEGRPRRVGTFLTARMVSGFGSGFCVLVASRETLGWNPSSRTASPLGAAVKESFVTARSAVRTRRFAVVEFSEAVTEEVRSVLAAAYTGF